MSHDHTISSSHDCVGCAVRDRREFLRAAGAALLAIGLAPAAARALGVSATAPLARRGNKLSYPLPQADGATIDKENAVILVRHAGAAYAFALSCPHQNTALRWLPDDGRFQCPKHKSQYEPDGTFISGRATRGMDRYAISRVGDAISVDLDVLYQEDENKAAWNAAVIRL